MNAGTKVVISLALLSAAGFGVAAIVIAKKKKDDAGQTTPDVPTATTQYRAKVYTDGSKYYAIVFRDDAGKSSVVQQLGPFDTSALAQSSAAATAAGIATGLFYLVRQDDAKAWWFDGYNTALWGASSAPIVSNGPYQSEQLATAAGSNWMAKEE